MRTPSIRASRWAALFAACLLCAFLLSGCSAPRNLVMIEELDVPLSAANVLTPTTGTVTYGSAIAVIDASNINEGYVMCKYSGAVNKIKVQITKSGGTTYTYNLNTDGKYEVFPLTAGNGSYTINIYENVRGDQYALAYGTSLSVELRNSFLPFLYPSQYVNFSAESSTVKKGEELTSSAADDLAIVASVYNYVINNITYDTAKANTISSGGLKGYLPSVDSILNSGKGICFDYAAVMAAMLRSQGIPTQLRVGYAGSAYHAWLGVYITDMGWINDAIYFDGQNWKLMDPTFASSANQSASIMEYIGNGSNYSTLYTY